ncbi:GPCR fungal pheromone mating factor, partial [Vararia minispora EC-137]
LLLLVLTTSFIRQSWNLGVSFLCFWLFWELFTDGINAIIWADNADLKLYIYCDIVTHLQMFTFIVKPACTLLITRRLYRIVSLRSVLLHSRKESLTDHIVEWTIGFGLPVLVTSVFYYIQQGARFQVLEGFGCRNTYNISGFSIITVDSWAVILPSISIFFYCPKMIYVFYHHSRDTNKFLRSDSSVSRPSYFRLLALACVDIILTLPYGIANVVEQVNGLLPGYSVPFFWGWESTHSNWMPFSISYAEIKAGGGWQLSNFYLSSWSSVALALITFAFFGATPEARAAYQRGFYAISKP